MSSQQFFASFPSVRNNSCCPSLTKSQVLKGEAWLPLFPRASWPTYFPCKLCWWRPVPGLSASRWSQWECLRRFPGPGMQENALRSSRLGGSRSDSHHWQNLPESLRQAQAGALLELSSNWSLPPPGNDWENSSLRLRKWLQPFLFFFYLFNKFINSQSP